MLSCEYKRYGMKEGQKLWTRGELILAINLYCKLPFGRLSSTTPEIKDLAKQIGRTAGSVALKLVNFSSLDPSLQARGIKGMGNASKLDKQVWDEFYNNWDAALLESEALLAQTKRTTLEQLHQIDLSELPKEGKEKERLVKTRVNQSLFRKVVMATYNSTCCITGINTPELLIASHIVPWSQDEHNRLNPMNGLCLNALHDRAFDAGLITIWADDYTIKVSSQLKKKGMPESVERNFLALEGKEIQLPDRFLPDRGLLGRHNRLIYNKRTDN
jgi:putative restriction endonuclease